MSDEKEIAQPPRAQQDTPVHCSKCGVFNERAADVCKDCGAHLRLKCKKCGASNLRTASRCARCYQLLRNGSTDFSFLKIRFKRRHWRLSRLKQQFQRLKGFAALLLVLAVIIWVMVGDFRFLGTQ
jgi:predicted amidophosphoribosyltransferase